MVLVTLEEVDPVSPVDFRTSDEPPQTDAQRPAPRLVQCRPALVLILFERLAVVRA